MSDDRVVSFHGGDEESGDVIAIKTRFPAGLALESHRHKHGHFSILASGTARVIVDGKEQVLTGPTEVSIPAGSQHTVIAVTPVVWYCLWGSAVAPIEEAEASLQIVESAAVRVKEAALAE